MCNAIVPGEPRGNTIEDSVQVCRWLDAAGVDALHVSSGGFFPHPRNPAGDLPVDEFVKVYDSLLSSGTKTFRNYLFFRGRLTSSFFERRWRKEAGKVREGINLADAHAVKQAVSIPVLCTGGFQTASFVRRALEEG
jgi:2,4-dienoyl-CoA reductase (NADPH2)